MAAKGCLILAVNAGAGSGTPQVWPGGKSMFIAEGTWGGGNVKLQTPGPNGTYIDLITISANGQSTMDLPAGTYRATVTTSTGVYANLVNCPS